MNYDIRTIAHSSQRYESHGDYLFDGNTGYVWVSDFGNEDIEFIIGIHEQIEMYLTRKRGIPETAISAFDMTHPELDDPGMDKLAPYHKEHFFCDIIDRLLCEQVGIAYEQYQEAKPI
jgi:hypothetical protein